MSDKERFKRQYTIIFMSVLVCFMLYGAVMLDRILVFYLQVSGELVYTTATTHIVTFGLIVGTCALYWARMFDSEYAGVLLVHRLNKLHLLSDSIMIFLGVITGLTSNGLFVIYMFIVGTGTVYDVILNVLFLLRPVYCARKYNMNNMRVHMFSLQSYVKCIRLNPDANIVVLKRRKDAT